MEKHILIVEDSPTQAFRAQFLLEEAGFKVSTAENGQAGFAMAVTSAPDLILADISMPVMDGNEMTRRLKYDARTAHIPVLMLTSNDQPLDVILGLEAGADHFMIKPYNNDYLIWRVKDLFNIVENTQENALPKQQELDDFSQKIIITRSREQVLQALLSATARIINCQAMALYIITQEGQKLLFPISFVPLKKSYINQISTHLTSVLSRIRAEDDRFEPAQITPIVVEETRFSAKIEGDLMASFMNTPLTVDGQVIGVLGVYHTIPEVFDLHNVGHLFDLGQQAAQALSRMQV